MRKQRAMTQVLQRTGISTLLADAAVFFLAIAMLGNGPAEAETRMSDTTAHTPADTQVECESRSARVKAVTAPGDHVTDAVYNFPPDGIGHFDSVPLLATQVTVEGPGASCLVAHFSVAANPLDNGYLFQVRVDDKPMQGHYIDPHAPSTPVVYESFFPAVCLDRGMEVPCLPSTNDDTGVRLMWSWNFFSRITPGVHTVEVLFAGCCGGFVPGGIRARVSSPVLTLEHR